MAIEQFLINEDPDFPALRVVNEWGTTEISLYGGNVISFVPQNKKQFGIWKNTNAIYKKGKAIRGGVPICFPWFSKHITDKNLPQHGFARTAMWQFVSHDVIDGKEIVTMELNDSPETRALWNHSFNLKLSLCCDKHLAMALTVCNTDTVAWTFSAALHAYVSISDIRNISIDCGKISQLVDSANNNAVVPLDGPIKVCAPMDYQHIQSQAEGRFNHVILNDLGKKRAQRFKVGPSFQLWNPWTEAKFDDMNPSDYTQFVCIEPAVLQRLPLTVKPQHSSTLIFSV